MDKVNLLITCPRGLEENTASNIYFILRSDLEDDKVTCKISSYPGIVYAYTSIDPVKVVEYMKKKVAENKWYLGRVAKITPIHRVTPISEDEVVRCAVESAAKIGTNETFKIQVNNRGKKLDSRRLISRIAVQINRQVNLENPDKILLIEVLDAFCGVSLIDEKSIIKNLVV